MCPTKEKLLKISDELFEKKIIGKGKLRDKKYDVNNGHIECSITSLNPQTRETIINYFKELGYVVKSGGYNYIEIYWEDENMNDIHDIFKKYK